MKNTHWIILYVLLLLLFLSFGMNAVTLLREELEETTLQLEEVREERDRLQSNLYWLTQTNPPRWVPPIDGPLYISSSIGFRTDPMGGQENQLHRGIDIAGSIGTPIRSVLQGVVIAHWPPPDGIFQGHPVYGGLVIIKHHDGLYTLYGHLNETFIHEGDFLETGEVIGTMGKTGIATGPHLHLEVIADPLSVDNWR